ncbi:hypothetical protein [Candidatus Rickettsia kedanie]|uniref:hypothetical protein n=1 Tax=Candidatus Rickettsia kedanie TaxID=3115352 RepID=UPI00399C4D04
MEVIFWIPAWYCCVDQFYLCIPWLDHGIQLKILKLLVFFIIFMDPVVKPRGDTVGFTIRVKLRKVSKQFARNLLIATLLARKNDI